jgi:hypothetical protein
MRSQLRWIAALLACTLLSQAGCRKASYDKTHTLLPGEVQIISQDSARSDQKVTITITSPGTPVNAYLVREEDVPTAKECIVNGKTPPKVFDSKEKAEEITLNAAIPARTGYALILSSAGKKAEARVRLTAR